MQSRLCSEHFYLFFEALQQKCDTIEELFANISASMCEIAADMGIGRMEMEMRMATTILEPQGQFGSIVLYDSPEGYDDTRGWQESFRMGNDGAAMLMLFPKQGICWEPEAWQSLSVLAKTIVAFVGKAHLQLLLEKSLKTDNLTGAVNTAGLMQYGGRMFAQGRLSEFTAVFLNLKNFKYINNRVGARVGDRILAEYARKNAEFIQADELLARPGGDNFLLLLKKERVSDYLRFASVITVTVRMENGEKREFEMRAKMGVYPIEERDTMGEVMNYASVALNVAKSQKREQDVVWYAQEMMERSMHARAILNAFPKALQKQEFIVYFQPKVDLTTEKLCGAEALVRWIRVDRVVRPVEFVGILEQEGLICQLDLFVFEEVCRMLREWLDAGIEPVRISTNFSKLHLNNHGLERRITAVMDKYQIPPQYIEIELTEMSGEEDFEEMSEFIRNMRAKGISVAIDDFGTGYSTLNMLKDLPVDVIKLDKSFLEDIEQERKEDRIVIRNIINMVKELEMTVLAEGVETAQQLAFLKEMQCEIIQGYFFDRPLLREEFELRLKAKDTYSKRLQLEKDKEKEVLE